MSDEQDRPVGGQLASDSEGPVGGERLAQARREQQISVLEVAKELHLDEPKVRALERNEFDVLGAPVFAKGHLRKYAQLVGVNEDDVFADYYAMTRASAMLPDIVGRKKVRREFSPGPWIAFVIVVIVAAAAYWWFIMRETAPVPVAAPIEQDDPVPQSSAQREVPVVLAVAIRGDEPGTDIEPQAESAAAIEPVAELIAQPLLDGQLRLSVSFSGDCWTEIKDADGRRLFVDMGRNGRTVHLTGTAPISALFGNADNVDVRVNGADYKLPMPISANRTVQLTFRNP